MTEQNDLNPNAQKVFEKAWSDENFKQQLLSNPTEVLKAEGANIPEGIEVRIIEQLSNVVYLTLPLKSEMEDDEKLSDEDLEQAAGGWAGRVFRGAAREAGNGWRQFWK